MPDAEDTVPPFDPFHLHRDDPFPYYRQARSGCPVAFNPVLGAYVVTGFDDVYDVLGAPDVYSSSVAIPRNDANPPEVVAELDAALHDAPGVRMVVADPPEHAALKALGSRLFRRERVAAASPQIRARAEALAAALTGDELDLANAFADPLAYGALCDFMGIPEADRDRVRAWNDDLITLLDPTQPLDRKLAAARGRREFGAWIDALVEDKRANPGEDMVSEMVQAGLAGDVREHVEGYLAAGIATTRDLVAGCVLALLRDEQRTYWKEIARDDDLAQRVVEEAMRFDAPHKGLSRVATRDTELAGTVIPQGSIVMPLVGSANRDERVFPDPDVFDPNRENLHRQLALGRGVHRCIGMHFARAVAAIGVAVLAEALPDARLADGYAPSYFPSPFFRGLIDLRIVR